MSVRVSGRLAAWNDLDDLYLFDVDRPVVPNENPRNLGRRQLRKLPAGQVMFSNFSGDIFYVMDGTDPDAMTEHFYSRAVVEDRAPQMDGPFIAWSICENLELLQGVFQPSYICADEPDVSVHVLDLNAPRVMGENPRIVATGHGHIREIASGPLGVAWRSGSGRDETLSYRNLAEPMVESVNPLAVYDGWPNAESADLEPIGLVFFTETRNEARQIRFINVVELLLATHENP